VRIVSNAWRMHESAWRDFEGGATCKRMTYDCSRVFWTRIRTRVRWPRSTCGEGRMEIPHSWSHERGESVLFEKGLGRIYAEAREAALAGRVGLLPDKSKNSLRAIREGILRDLAGRGWRIGVSIFPSSAPAMFQRGHYRLDAAKTTGSGATLGVVCHFGGSEFLLRQFMLISEAVRRGIVDCAVLELMTREAIECVRGRPACYEQARRSLRLYGQSAFGGIPMVLWGLIPEATHLRTTGVGEGLPAGLQ